MTDKERVLTILQMYETGVSTHQAMLEDIIDLVNESNVDQIVGLIPGTVIHELKAKVDAMPHSDEGWGELLVIFGGVFLPEGVSSDEEYQARFQRFKQGKKHRFRRGVEALREYFEQNSIP